MMAWLTNSTLSLPVRQVLPEVMRGLIFFSNYVIQIKNVNFRWESQV